MGPYQTVCKNRTQDVLRDRTQYTEPHPDWLTEPKAVHGTACVSVNNCRNYHGQRLTGALAQDEGRGVFVPNQMAITKHLVANVSSSYTRRSANRDSTKNANILEHLFGPERAMCTSRRKWRLQRQAAKGMLHAAPTKHEERLTKSACGTHTKGKHGQAKL